MGVFKVKNIIDSKTIEVQGWQLGDSYRGKLVKIEGYDVPLNFAEYVKNKLSTLLEGKSVDLKNVKTYEKGVSDGNDIIFCRVYLDDIDIATYFMELKALTK